MRFQASRTFIPSQYSDGYGAYGADEEEGEEEEPITTAENAEQQSTSEMLTKYAPFLQAILGFGGAADKAAKLRGKLDTLESGGAEAWLTARGVCGLACSVETAIKKVQEQLESAESEAHKARTRDTLYTALTVTGVLAGGMFVLWLGTKAWSGYQETKIQQEKLKRLQAGG